MVAEIQSEVVLASSAAAVLAAAELVEIGRFSGLVSIGAFVVSHPWRKNKNAPRMGHPEFQVSGLGLLDSMPEEKRTL